MLTNFNQNGAKILVTGGAGYIGSHLVELLVQNNYEVIVFDNLSTGSAAAVKNAKLIVGDLLDFAALKKLFQTYRFDAVMHLAAVINVHESVLNPDKYYQNNLVGGLNLLRAMNQCEVNKIIFSSSAAVYGEPRSFPLGVDHPKNPLNPYGKSKLFFEEILRDYEHSSRVKSISLRYFNAAGADPSGNFGPRIKDATHLIPVVLKVARGISVAVEVFGTDYPTRDGTCIRDYIHVSDLCSAHLQALKKLDNLEVSKAYNLGNGLGFSVLEVIKAAEKVTGKVIHIIKEHRREGDPAVLVADASLAQIELGWQPIYSDLDTIISHSWNWINKVLRFG